MKKETKKDTVSTPLHIREGQGKGLLSHYYEGKIEVGCDEAGRGCLAGSVYAAAVILPPDYQN